MFTNKHVIVAMIVAPVLAILAWFSVGEFIGEKPQVARPGQSYPLVEKSNCRYESGLCELENKDFRLKLFYRNDAAGRQLVLRASHALEGVVISVGVPEGEEPPGAMRSADEQGLEWRLALDSRPTPEERIRLVASAAGSTYFGEAGTLFLQPGDGDAMQR
jgi:hypothetical protein